MKWDYDTDFSSIPGHIDALCKDLYNVVREVIVMTETIEKEVIRPGIYAHWRGGQFLVLGMATFVAETPLEFKRDLDCVHLFTQETVDPTQVLYLYQLEDETLVYQASQDYGDVVIFGAGACPSSILFFRTYEAFTESFDSGQRRYSWVGSLSELAAQA